MSAPYPRWLEEQRARGRHSVTMVQGERLSPNRPLPMDPALLALVDALADLAAAQDSDRESTHSVPGPSDGTAPARRPLRAILNR